MTFSPVRCSCYVDPAGDGKWLVTVWGESPHDARREYTIASTCEDDAAMEGLRNFEDEFRDT